LFILSKFSFEIVTSLFKKFFIKAIESSEIQLSFNELTVESIFQFNSKEPEIFLKIFSGRIFFSFCSYLSSNSCLFLSNCSFCSGLAQTSIVLA
jgi:hypothetical protein